MNFTPFLSLGYVLELSEKPLLLFYRLLFGIELFL